MSTIAELLRQQVTLDVESLDRIYLNGYVPNLQVPGQLVNFLCKHLGNTIPSPALLQRIGDVFVRQVHSFAEEQAIPIVHFERGVRKDDVAAGYRQGFTAAEGVVFIGVAQERAQAFRAHKRSEGNMVGFDYSRQSVCVNHYYFYLQDEDFCFRYSGMAHFDHQEWPTSDHESGYPERVRKAREGGRCEGEERAWGKGSSRLE